MTAGGSTTREEHRKRERQNAEMQVEGTGNIRFTRRDACLQCTRSDFCSIPLRFCASSSFHALPTTMNILCPRTSGVRSAPLQQMKFERSMRIHQIGSCCVETEAPQFTKWNCETIFVGIYHERCEKYMCKKKWKILQCRSWYRRPMRRPAISCRQSCAIRQYRIFNDAMCASVWLEM